MIEPGREPGVHLYADQAGQQTRETERAPERALWTAPRTWVAGETLTASIFNTHVRDNQLWLGGGDALSTTPPGAPINWQYWILPVDTTAGIFWHFRYYTTLAAWVFQGGPDLLSTVNTVENGPINTAVYSALATPGPTVTTPRAGDYIVQHGCTIVQGNVGTEQQYMSYDIGATAAVDADAARENTQVQGISISRTNSKTGLAASTALTAKYKNNPGSSTSTYGMRFLSIRPVKVT